MLPLFWTFFFLGPFDLYFSSILEKKKTAYFEKSSPNYVNILRIFEMMAEIEKKSVLFDPHFEMMAELRLFSVYFEKKKNLLSLYRMPPPSLIRIEKLEIDELVCIT